MAADYISVRVTTYFVNTPCIRIYMHSVAYDFIYHYQIILRKAKSAKNVSVAELISGSARVCDFFQLGGKGKCLSMACGNSWGS